MADNVDSKSEAPDEDGVISLDDLDSLLAEEDPEFADEMQKMSEDEELRNAEVEVVDFEHPDEEIQEEPKKTFIEKHPKLGKVIQPLKNFHAKIKQKIRAGINNAYRKFHESILWLKNDFPGFAKQQLQNSKDFAKKSAENIKKTQARYKALPKRTKWGMYTTVFFAITVGVVIYISIQKSWIPALSEPLYTSLEEVADEVSEGGSNEYLKSLYQAFPQQEHFVQLDKAVVNLKRTNNYTIPMAAMEFYLELDSTDTAIEIKDREKQVIDSIQRTVEQFTYEELRTKPGISKMKAAVRYGINTLLNQGRVNKVHLKTFIIKP